MMEQVRQQFDAMLQNQAVIIATDRIFLILGVLLTIASFSIWLTRRPRPAGGSDGRR